MEALQNSKAERDQLDVDIKVKKAEVLGLDKMLAEKNAEIKNLTETMQKKIESINDDDNGTTEGKEMI